MTALMVHSSAFHVHATATFPKHRKHISDIFTDSNMCAKQQHSTTRMVQLPATTAIEYVAAWNEN